MKIILSPAKKMKVDRDSIPCSGLPEFLDQTQEILTLLQSMTPEELKKLWKCNDAIVTQNLQRLETMNLTQQLTPAILSYEGLAYQYMAPAVFEDQHLGYVQEHLRILSGFYGVLRPLDGVSPYRLEMQAKLKVGNSPDLYDYWGDRLYQAVRDDSGIFINLASKEYYKCIEKYLTKQDAFITCTFAEEVSGKMVQKGTIAKMARGEMVRFMAENCIEDPWEMQKFDRLDFHFRNDLSTDNEYIFQRIPHE